MVRLFVAALALVAGVAQSLTVSRGSEEVASGEFQSSLAWTPPALEPAPAVSPSAWWEEKWHPLELIIPVLGVPGLGGEAPGTGRLAANEGGQGLHHEAHHRGASEEP
mmetsp:Transcript_176424/g.560396  ORF Transcript_176424/g.560396 Transcript_176424/m.560396 type:complete len:108 (-) Transcript_176424:264-587(-)